MSSQYAVVAADLRAAARQYARVQAEFGTTPPALHATTSDALGDGDLASWVHAVVDQLAGAHRSLHDDTGSMATLLNAQADRYEQADTTASTSIGALTPLLGPSQPDVCAAPTSPLSARLGPP